jgi:hypothetical protein
MVQTGTLGTTQDALCLAPTWGRVIPRICPALTRVLPTTVANRTIPRRTVPSALPPRR